MNVAVRKSLREVAKKYRLTLVVRFGSTATGRTVPGSDLDVGVMSLVPRSRRNARWQFGLANALAQALGEPRELDLVLLHDASPILLFEVAREGVPLWEASPTTFVEFKSLAARMYDDTEKYRRATREWLDERLG